MRVTTKSLNLAFSFLRNSTQSIRINNIATNVKLYMVSRKVQCLDLYYLVLIDLFLECEDNNTNNYADDITPYFCTEDIYSVIMTKLQRIANKIFRWTENNHVKVNPRENHVL